MARTGVDRESQRVTTLEEEILRLLFDFHYLTAEQLTRLRYSPTSINHARELLKRLFDKGLVGRTFGPRSQPAGSVPWVYFLARKGRRLMSEMGLETERRYRPSEERRRTDTFLFHTLAVNDVLVAAKLLERHIGAVMIAGMRHDLDLKRNPVKLPTGKVDQKTGEVEQESISPDGWVNFRARLPDRERPVSFPLLLEIDRDTEGVDRIKKKVRGLLSYIKEPYQEIFGTRYVTVAFIVEDAACRRAGGPDKRLADLVRWAEETLKDLGQEKQANLFVFTTLPSGHELDPVEFFLSPRALQPFSDVPLSLLDLPTPIKRTNGQSKPLSVYSRAVR